jgi:hypothetical protein
LEGIFSHWTRDVLEIFFDTFLKAANSEGGLAQYKGTHAGRIVMIKRERIKLTNSNYLFFSTLNAGSFSTLPIIPETHPTANRM